MKAADHVHFGDAAGQRFSHCGDDFIDRAFKSMRVALLRGEGAELAGEDADVGIVDVTIEDVGRGIAILPLTHGAGHDPESIEIMSIVELKRILIGDPLIQIDLLGNRSECRWNERKFHGEYALCAGKVDRLMMHSRMRQCKHGGCPSENKEGEPGKPVRPLLNPTTNVLSNPDLSPCS